MSSTIIGKSGRLYVPGQVLWRHPKDDSRSIFKAESEQESFVLKRVPGPFYDLSERLLTEFAGSRRLRMHVDCNREEHILIYPYFGSTLLSLIQSDAEFPVPERKRILRRVAEAIQELHERDWIHIDVKPDNILVNCTQDKIVTDAALGDFDLAHKSESGKPFRTPRAIGNAMWRSPEGQTGTGVTKASDIISFGLVCIFTFGGGELLLLHNYQELVKNGIPPEQEILIRHFMYFGLVPQGLLDQVDEYWHPALKGASGIAELELKEHPHKSFASWGRELGSEAHSIMLGMTNPDPAARITIEQVLAHPWWSAPEE